MKKFLLIISIFVLPVLFVQLVSCSKTPTSPIITIGSSGTSTFTPTPSGPTNTPTQTLVPGAPTYTPTLSPTTTPTVGLTPAPVYYGTNGISASPNGFSYVPGAPSTLWVAEGEIAVGGDVSNIEGFTLSGNTLSSVYGSNLVVIGYATPMPAYPTPGYWQGVTVTTSIPQGIASGGGFYGLLDSPPSGSASLYEGCYGFSFPAPGKTEYPNYGTSYGGSQFMTPKGLAADSNGNFYVADTGNGYVDVFGPACSTSGPPSPGWTHRWSGYANGGEFKQPYAVACDSNNNVYVGDTGYSPSIIEEFGPDGTSLLNGPITTISGCVVHGITLDNNVSPSNIYVADAGNDMVEEYSGGASAPVGTLLRKWGKPVGMTQVQPFIPSSIALIPPIGITNIVVGISNPNSDVLVVFGP